ncbi:hypothetical protein GIS00_18915 [Nakamurella sp. YIM 132087]|uniref:Uncharacterized protein n=1 Tax=Nakamurella alba TaxID=2665158 RepID=A0A7K1FPD8_9ACTN|nr:hypothetical protein [Nakamurella alba]MTD16012.1 hypothetical protein [Nakamurella alba]
MELDFETIKTTAMWVLIGLAVVAIVLAIVIKKIVGKIITLVLAAVIIFFGWQQRDRIVSYAEGAQNAVGAAACDSPSFFGIDVTLPGCPGS